MCVIINVIDFALLPQEVVLRVNENLKVNTATTAVMMSPRISDGSTSLENEFMITHGVTK